MNKLEWLNWATEQGLIEREMHEGCIHWYVKSLKSPLVADEVDGKIEFYPTFMLVVLDWIDERGWVLTQLSEWDFNNEELFHGAYIFEPIKAGKLKTYKRLNKSDDGYDSRLKALLEAFKEAVTNG